MTKPSIRIHNIETDEIIDREMTDAEYVEYQKFQQSVKAEKQVELAAQAAKETAQAKLEALGLTTDDLRALGL